MGGTERFDSFEEIYREVFPVLYRVVYHLTGGSGAAEEICQEAFIKYLQRGTPFPSAEQARYWLIRVAKNQALNYVRRKGRESRAIGRFCDTAPVAAPGSEAEYFRREARSAVRKGLLQLPPRLRAVLVLKEFGGLTYREIGRILRISEGNVKVRVYRARLALEKVLKEDLDVS